MSPNKYVWYQVTKPSKIEKVAQGNLTEKAGFKKLSCHDKIIYISDKYKVIKSKSKVIEPKLFVKVRLDTLDW